MAGKRALADASHFLLIWAGQVVSLFGSALTAFALGIWVYLQTGSVLRFALVALCTAVPRVVLAPLVGAIIDRANRRTIMLIADVVAAASTLVIALAFWTDHLQVWLVYASTLVSAVCNAFRAPAYASGVTLLVPKRHLGRANGLVQMGEAADRILAPLVAGALLGSIGLTGVVLIDLGSFVVGIVTLGLARMPQVAGPASSARSLRREIAYGWSYLLDRPALVGLMIVFLFSNFIVGIIEVLVTPLVLAVGSPTTLGSVLTIGGVGMLTGTLVMAAWGGPRNRIHGVLLAMVARGLFAAIGGLHASFPLFAAAAFGFFFALPIERASSLTIFQRKVAPSVQGRVFSISTMVAQIALPAGYLVAGPLADRFEPLMASQGALAASAGHILGTGPGRGVGLLFVLSGVIYMAVALTGYLYPRLRRVDHELRDAVEVEAA